MPSAIWLMSMLPEHQHQSPGSPLPWNTGNFARCGKEWRFPIIVHSADLEPRWGILLLVVLFGAFFLHFLNKIIMQIKGRSYGLLEYSSLFSTSAAGPELRTTQNKPQAPHSQKTNMKLLSGKFFLPSPSPHKDLHPVCELWKINLNIFLQNSRSTGYISCLFCHTRIPGIKRAATQLQRFM